ncbi:DUF3108 domain-containing protein [Cellvibrio zantedeschiae]|nr:DUF3108 domain-containing protein [Cellvibrio zantedeschiae]
MARLGWLVGIVLLQITNLAHAGELTPFENKYSAKLYGFTIDVTSKLNAQADGIFEFSFDANSTLGRVTETSQFKWNSAEDFATPLQYHYKRTGVGKNKEQILNFDWAKNEVINTKNDARMALDASKKIQDSLSYQLQLRQDLMAKKKNLSYLITNAKKNKEYKFEIVGDEVLDTPLGKVNTVKIKRVQTSDERETYAWFAKDFQYLLVRLQQEENGSAYTIYISKASLNGKAIEHF